MKIPKMKVIQNLMLNHILFYHLPEKTCWKKLSKLSYFDVGSSSGAAAPLSKQNKYFEMLITFFSKFFQEKGKTKCDSALNLE